MPAVLAAMMWGLISLISLSGACTKLFLNSLLQLYS